MNFLSAEFTLDYIKGARRVWIKLMRQAIVPEQRTDVPNWNNEMRRWIMAHARGARGCTE